MSSFKTGTSLAMQFQRSFSVHIVRAELSDREEFTLFMLVWVRQKPVVLWSEHKLSQPAANSVNKPLRKSVSHQRLLLCMKRPCRLIGLRFLREIVLKKRTAAHCWRCRSTDNVLRYEIRWAAFVSASNFVCLFKAPLGFAAARTRYTLEINCSCDKVYWKTYKLSRRKEREASISENNQCLN